LSLKVIATPIGDPGDITLRAIEALRDADIVIGEERKEVSKLLKRLGLEQKPTELLNEHADERTIADLLLLCRDKNVALVSDCGTPGFCDPGARLVAACRAEKIPVTPLPGASSLMCLLSMSGENLRQFLFRGFLPAEREERAVALREILREAQPAVLMDTPYRFAKLLAELSAAAPERVVLIGMNFTQETEQIWQGTALDAATVFAEQKAEFILLLFPGAVAKIASAGAKKSVIIPAPNAHRANPRHPFPRRRR
jgi:16S rRNA (cytidine1402-2'-O)-methyltransferase